jgi:putative ABC transport system permease protein
MPLRELVLLAFESLRANLFRAALTMLGIIIGVCAIVLLVSMGSGAKNYIFNEFQSLGTNLIIVQPGKTDKKSAHGPPIGSAQRKMTIADVDAIERKALSIAAVTGLILGSTTVRTEDAVSNVSVFGCNERMLDILNLQIGEGAFFGREEDQYGRRVVVIGYEVARTLFGTQFAVGKQVKIHHSEFRVIGVMAKTGSKLGLNLDEFVHIPTRAALRLFNDDKLFGIRAKARSRAEVDFAVQEITTILKERRDGEEDFTVLTQDSMMESMETILQMLTYVLAGIASISMLVAGIGIMNIMLVSVAERTQEIGIRRAVGARQRDILRQFLVEAMFLSLLGGLTGILISVGLTYGIYFYFPSFDMRAPGWIIPLALGVSVFTGTCFGLGPAWKAARIETLDALRYE